MVYRQRTAIVLLLRCAVERQFASAENSDDPRTSAGSNRV